MMIMMSVCALAGITFGTKCPILGTNWHDDEILCLGWHDIWPNICAQHWARDCTKWHEKGTKKTAYYFVRVDVISYGEIKSTK